MASHQNKVLLWLFILCFALSQALSPLVHAHIGDDAVDAEVGAHLHEKFIADSDAGPVVTTVQNLPTDSYIVSLGSAVVKKSDPQWLAPVFLMSLSLLGVVLVGIRLRPGPSFQPIPIIRRSRLNPRAPPAL